MKMWALFTCQSFLSCPFHGHEVLIRDPSCDGELIARCHSGLTLGVWYIKGGAMYSWPFIQMKDRRELRTSARTKFAQSVENQPVPDCRRNSYGKEG